ncbi:MAG: universal stress protein [Dehalococcoidia bacterium]|nr:MAG: universal stress protein [Dehalococcoidia bacterium]
MFKKILVPLDGSRLAEEVICPYVIELSVSLDLDVIILHVCSPGEQAFNTMHKAYVDQIAETIANQAKEVQLKTALKKKAKTIIIKGEITIGYPAEQILSYAEKYKFDFILMATHGYSGIKKWSISSVADKVLRSSKIPVLLVRTEITQEITYDKWPHIKLLIPLDSSKLAESVLPYVEKLAKQRCDKELDVVLMAVCEQYSIPSELSEASQMYGWKEYVNHMTSELKKMYKQYLTGVEKNLTDSGLRVKSKILLGKAAQRINEFAIKEPFCLTVLATHGRTGYVSSDYGDVTNKVIREGVSPIFLVRTH